MADNNTEWSNSHLQESFDSYNEIKNGNAPNYKQNYAALLARISDTVINANLRKNLASINLFKIDLDAREIIAPADYLDFIGVVGEHRAETITFQVDRYYEDVDLADMCIVVEYVNAQGEGRVAPILVRDFITFDNQILFDWVIDSDFYKEPGIVEFDVRFFMIGDSLDPDGNRALVYSLRTKPFTSRILDTLPLDLTEFQEEYESQFASELDQLIGMRDALQSAIDNKKFFWKDII